MVSAPALPAYAETAGKLRKMLTDTDGKQPGDPARAADAMIAVVDLTIRRCGCRSAIFASRRSARSWPRREKTWSAGCTYRCRHPMRRHPRRPAKASRRRFSTLEIESYIMGCSIRM